MKKQSKQAIRLGKQIKKTRKGKKISQETLAEKIGVSTVWLRKLETGIYYPNIKTLIKIAKAVGVKVKDLIPF